MQVFRDYSQGEGQAAKVMGVCLFYFFGVANVVILFGFYKFMGYRLCQSLWTLTKFMYTTIYKVMKE
ncbi:hypothetical protein HMPREF9073_02238 [Capnocytophaga sp. oral taxon 326 str. F0382]|nr:hypothetical protein HMPREF9073_02238 [Capnocytophaga sp. oral taxon 326 str. F0382]